MKGLKRRAQIFIWSARETVKKLENAVEGVA